MGMEAQIFVGLFLAAAAAFIGGCITFGSWLTKNVIEVKNLLVEMKGTKERDHAVYELRLQRHEAWLQEHDDRLQRMETILFPQIVITSKPPTADER